MDSQPLPRFNTIQMVPDSIRSSNEDQIYAGIALEKAQSSGYNDFGSKIATHSIKRYGRPLSHF